MAALSADEIRASYIKAILVQALGLEYTGAEICVHCKGSIAVGKPMDPRGPFDRCVALAGDQTLAGCANCHWYGTLQERYGASDEVA